MKILLLLLLLISPSIALAQVTCTISGPPGYAGQVTSSITVNCPGTIPPVIKPPSTSCDATQTASVGGKTLQRQCSGSMNVYPSGPSYYGPIADLGTVLGGSSWPSYKYTGYSPTFTINTGQYISLAFMPTSSGTIQFAVNLSYGDGGIISVSTQPGSLVYGSPGLLCSQSRNGVNSITIGTGSGVDCPVSIGVIYFINFSDVDTSGNAICNGSPNSCSSAQVSYTLYTSK